MTAQAASVHPTTRKPIVPSRVLLYAVLVLLTLAFVLPVYVALNTSLKSFEEVSQSGAFAPVQAPTLAAYLEAFGALKGGLLNSLLLALPATVLSALLGSMNGYVLSKWKFKGADTLFTLLLFGMFIPYQAILIPLFQFLQSIGLAGSLWALILVHIVYGIPITTLIFRNYYAGVPDALIEAAKIDGAGLLGIYRWVLFPLSLPGFVVVCIWQFTSIWNEFLFAVTLTSPATQPVTVALQGLGQGLISHYEVQMAGAVLAALPTLVVYILLGRYFVQGLLAGSVKG
ncbi:glucose/mannose transport system permease protein [Deinobacterium chartae]|uniref:Glucose/mannose transport system permease protein n=1 Tax=Deinobacterium chartae TaxID=521158 RepID=A0A841HY45_9DEIO|nr:carbohydrate ABC transporter permease [Deinobacterium chartae]MBB6097803.1 glucose/mannose transport system permease protein [Deinobacterium chartae]